MSDTTPAAAARRPLPSAATLLAAQVRYQFRLLFATPSALVIGVGLPVILLIAANAKHTGAAASDAAGYAVFGLTMTAWNTNGVRLVASREQGILRRWRAAPLPPWCYFTGRIVAISLFATMAAVVTLLTGMLFYGIRFGGAAWAVVVAVLIVGALAWAAASTAMTSIVPGIAAAQPTFVLTYFPVVLLSGALGHLSGEPGWLATAVSYLPGQPVIDTVSRAIGHGDPVSAHDMLVLAAWAAASLLIAVARFRWEPYRPAQHRPARAPAPASPLRCRCGSCGRESLMPHVQTVLGPVDAGNLGRTLMHEHVFVLTADVQQNYPDEWGEEDERVADAVRRLSRLPEQGISTIVDVTVIGQGRNIARVKRIGEQVPGLNIVVATGCYTFDEVPLFFWRRPPQAMTELFVRDITEGVAGTGVKAGMLKCAVDEKGLTPGVEQVLRSVAQAHVQTQAPVTIHTHAASKHGPAILQVLKQEGADLDRVVLGHSGDAVTDPGYLQEMAEAGLTLGMDRFGIDHFATFEARSALVAELCRRGLADRMVLSHDTCCYIDWFAPGSLDDLTQWHYLHISQDVLPYLRDHGVTEEQIDAMLVRNPARILAG